MSRELRIISRIASSVGRFVIPKSVPAGRRKRTEELLSILDNGYQNREIWNADFKEARDYLNRTMDKGGRNLQASFLSIWDAQPGGSSSWADTANDIYYSFPSGLHQLGSFSKKLSKYDGFLKKEMGWGFEGELICVFHDGTQFTVRNKVVYKMSMGGNDFVQFPTTFHNVLWPDGKKISMVPEKQMNEEWAVI
jgi:hypothetical protein